MKLDEYLDLLEAEIVRISNENISDPRIQELMNQEATLVLANYYGQTNPEEVFDCDGEIITSFELPPQTSEGS